MSLSSNNITELNEICSEMNDTYSSSIISCSSNILNNDEEFQQQSSLFPQPIFPTHKLKIIPLREEFAIYSFQLEAHLRETGNIYSQNSCNCITPHVHYTQPCRLVSNQPACLKCGCPNKLIIDYKSQLFHLLNQQSCVPEILEFRRKKKEEYEKNKLQGRNFGFETFNNDNKGKSTVEENVLIRDMLLANDAILNVETENIAIKNSFDKKYSTKATDISNLNKKNQTINKAGKNNDDKFYFCQNEDEELSIRENRKHLQNILYKKRDIEQFHVIKSLPTFRSVDFFEKNLHGADLTSRLTNTCDGTATVSGTNTDMITDSVIVKAVNSGDEDDDDDDKDDYNYLSKTNTNSSLSDYREEEESYVENEEFDLTKNDCCLGEYDKRHINCTIDKCISTTNTTEELLHLDNDEQLSVCCPHMHYPPCGVCLRCSITNCQHCIVEEPFECRFTTTNRCFGYLPKTKDKINTNTRISSERYSQNSDDCCSYNNLDANKCDDENTIHQTQPLYEAKFVREHIYKTQMPLFYLCNVHAHTHNHESIIFHRRVKCLIQTSRCCEHARFFTEHDSSIVVVVVDKRKKRRKRAQYPTTNLSTQFSNVADNTVCNYNNYSSDTDDDSSEERTLLAEVKKNNLIKRKRCKKNKIRTSKRVKVGVKMSRKRRFSKESGENEKNKCKRYDEKCLSNLKKYLSSEKTLPNVETFDTRNQLTVKDLRRESKLWSIKQYIVFEPTLLREQSMNYLISFLRAIPRKRQSILDRYKRYESSNFKVANIKKYKSGKRSITRREFTGFLTYGSYQTATISCKLKKDEIMIPQKIWKMLDGNYNLSMVTIKRDPGIKSTCTFVCKVIRNPNPNDDVIKINQHIANPMNQDQDGDKNALPGLSLYFENSYDCRESYIFKLALLELSKAQLRDQSLIATPRYSISENNLQLIHKFAADLLLQSEFYQRTKDQSPDYWLNAGSGYLREEFLKFNEILNHLNETKNKYLITFDDIVRRTTVLEDIIKSGAKGHMELLDDFTKNLFQEANTKKDRLENMVDQMFRYVVSSQNIRKMGRLLFASLCLFLDLITVFGEVYNVKEYFADFKTFSAATCTIGFNEASCCEFLKDLFEQFNLFFTDSYKVLLSESESEAITATDAGGVQKEKCNNNKSIDRKSSFLFLLDTINNKESEENEKLSTTNRCFVDDELKKLRVPSDWENNDTFEEYVIPDTLSYYELKLLLELRNRE